MPLRPCLICGGLGPSSYCAKHRPKGGSHELRGSGGKRATFRRLTLARTGGRCAVVECHTPWHNVQAHHLVALADGGDPNGPGGPMCEVHHRAANAAQRLVPLRIAR